MQENYKNLGQVHPVAGILTDLYICNGTAAVISSINICNTSDNFMNEDTFRISHAVTGAADNIAQYLYYDIIIKGQDTFQCTPGISMAQNDVLRVYSTNGTCSFNLYGTELA